MNNGQNSSVDYENVNAAQELIIPVLQYHHNPGTIFSNFSFLSSLVLSHFDLNTKLL